METPSKESELDERFKAILTQDLSSNQSSRWTMIIIVVVIVTITVGAAWYYMKNKKQLKKETKSNDSTKTVKNLKLQQF